MWLTFFSFASSMSMVLKETLFIDSHAGIQWLGSERFALGFAPDWAP